ncbi:MAG: hypothetical protein IJF03_12440 [Lachnospiraceae bacterium]|nr:hypothetical protein [Lachnospiraceae bacterium]
MHNIKKIGIRILLILAVLFVYENVVQFLYSPYNLTGPFIAKERKALTGEIETLLCGTSTVQRGIDPEIIDSGLGTVSFNTASSAQPLDGTYEVIKDMAKRNPVETVILGIAPSTMMNKDGGTEYKTYVYNRLDGIDSKFSYLLHGCSLEEWPYILLYSARVEDYFDGSAIQKNLEVKLSQEYKSGKIINSNYKTKGMIANRKKLKEEQINTLEKGKCKLSPKSIKEQNMKQLVRIVEYCKENQIELILVYVPLSGNAIQAYGDISEMHDYFVKFAEEQDVVFWDFNYYKELKALFTNDKFEDKKHLNKYGAEIFSEELVSVYNRYQSGENVETDFLDTCPYYLDLETLGEKE